MQVHRTVVDGVLLFLPVPDGRDDATLDATVASRHGVDPARFRHSARSRSTRGAVRGLHGRHGAGETTLVGCPSGAMQHVVVDARPASTTFGRVASFLLDDSDTRRLLVPAGCLHGFQALSEIVEACYRTDTPPDPAESVTVRVDDPDLAVRWSLPVATTSAGDRDAVGWSALCDRLGVPTPERECPVGW